MQDPVWTNDNVMTLLQLVLYDDYSGFGCGCSTIQMQFCRMDYRPWCFAIFVLRATCCGLESNCMCIVALRIAVCMYS